MAQASELGQATVEWIGLTLLAALAFAGLATGVGPSPAGFDLGRAIASKVVCAARLDAGCDDAADRLASEYGADVAADVRAHAPTIHYHDGAEYLPVDPGRCREPSCARASGSGEVWETSGGLPATAFTRVIDCRSEAARRTESGGADCSGERAGRLYVQYWLYYPESRTEPWGERGHHVDDWESLQVRIGAGADGRASSHHSYNYRGGIRNWPSDAGLIERPGWGAYTGELHVSAASHAGHVRDDGRGSRRTPAGRLELVPIEPVAAAVGVDHDFAVSPPWRKQVYLDPEANGT